MTSISEVQVQHGALSEATAKKVQDLIGDKGTLYSPEPADEPFKPGTSFHSISTEIYVDSEGHVHAVLIDEHHTSDGVVIEILADVPIN
jgi:hypothetical protein